MIFGYDYDEKIEVGLNKIFKAYGVAPSNLIIFSGVLISSLGLSSALDAAVWIVSVFSIFSFTYLFRSIVSGNLLVSLIVSVLLFAAFISPSFTDFGYTAVHQLQSTVGNDTKLWTAYIATLVGIPFSIILLSYSKTDQQRIPVATNIEEMVAKNIYQNDFHYSRVHYRLSFKVDGDYVILRFKMSVKGINRNNEAKMYKGHFEPAGHAKKFHEFRLNNLPIDTNDPDKKTHRGFILEFEASPGEEFDFFVDAESTYKSSDTEFISAYRPTAEFLVELEPTPLSLDLNVQSHLFEKVDGRVIDDAGSKLFHLPKGILPHQGFRFFWKLKEN